MYKNILWDMDGTLTDSSEGIIKCYQLALEHFGKTGYTAEELRCVIGPPLRYSFPNYGLTEAESEEAVKVFRSRYNTVGKFENRPYDGIAELLKKLKEEGFHLYVATSKPEDTAVQICDKFGLTEYFDLVCGATMDSSRDKKEKVIAYLLEKIVARDAALSKNGKDGDQAAEMSEMGKDDNQTAEMSEMRKGDNQTAEASDKGNTVNQHPDELSSAEKVISENAQMSGSCEKKKRNDIVMIGDTRFDVEGAAVFDIPTICVSWGFGERQEMIDAGALQIVDTMEELYEALRK